MQPNANKFVGGMIASGDPFSIIRLRSETDILKFHMQSGRIPKHPRYALNGGLFPLTDRTLETYARHVEEGLRVCDAVLYFKHLERQHEVFKVFSDAPLLPTSANKPYVSKNPWSSQLRGKSVLVIHPFADTMASQFEKRELLFENRDTLPPFNLETYKTIQTSGGGSCEHETWEDALNSMLGDVSKINFDVALIGCGCYDIPIATHIKGMGRQAFIMGGLLQCMFGIKGKRWDRRHVGKTFYNEHWVRPPGTDRPTNYRKIEKGCYW
jgi:hypothetical protein